MPTYQFIKNLLRNVDDLQLDSDHLMVISLMKVLWEELYTSPTCPGINMGMFYKRRDYTTIVDGRNLFSS